MYRMLFEDELKCIFRHLSYVDKLYIFEASLGEYEMNHLSDTSFLFMCILEIINT